MNYFTILLLLLFAALALAQTYRLRDARDVIKSYKASLSAEQSSKQWWRSKANWLLQFKQEADMWRNWSRMEVLNERPTLHAKKLRRILNAHYKRQYMEKLCANKKPHRSQVANYLFYTLPGLRRNAGAKWTLGLKKQTRYAHLKKLQPLP